MLEGYSVNLEVSADSPVMVHNISVDKGCAEKFSSPGTIQLNKCGVYMVSVDASAGTATTLQLVRNGVSQPQAQSTGTSPSFTTLVQVSTNNSCKCCDSPVDLQVMNSTATTLTNFNIVVTKVC